MDGEAGQAYGSCAGKALKAQLADLGVDLEPVRITLPDGSRPNRYTLAALEKAATDARKARK
jgi:S-DNA-T family DNA segregation ATPase FtsK/SpoIIIE